MLTLSALLGAVIVLAIGIIVLRQTDRIRPFFSGDEAEISAESAERRSGLEEDRDDSEVESETQSSDRSPQTSLPSDDGDTGAGEELGFELLACPEGTIPEVCDAAEFVQIERQRPFKEFPRLELVDGDDFAATFLDDLDEDREELEAARAALVGLGLIPADYDLFSGYKSLIGSGALGVYFPETGEMKVRGGDFNLFAQSVLVHELTHALDDQYFDLSREFDDGEMSYGFVATIEGNAQRVESAWRDELSPVESLELRAQEATALSLEDTLRLAQVPVALLQFLQSPYSDGQLWVESVVRAEGEAGVDAALTAPPATSEQILHPDIAPELGAVTEVPIPEPGGEVVEEGVLGELTLRIWLGPGVAAGWGGDQYVAWFDDDGRGCFAANIAADSPRDLLEMETALERWVEEAVVAPDVERNVEQGGENRRYLAVTGCA